MCGNEISVKLLALDCAGYSDTKNSPVFLEVSFRNERENNGFGLKEKTRVSLVSYLPVLYLRVYLFQMKESQGEYARPQLVCRL